MYVGSAASGDSLSYHSTRILAFMKGHFDNNERTISRDFLENNVALFMVGD